MAETAVKTNLPLHIPALESPEGYQGWKRKMQQYLIANNLWEWIEEDSKELPTAEIPKLADDGSNQPVVTAAKEALAIEVKRWKRGHLVACNAIFSVLGTNYVNDFENETNAHKLWNGIVRDCRPKGSGTLNDLYRRLDTLTLASCKDAADYAGQFKNTHNEITNIHSKCHMNTNFLIYRFHTGLGREYQDYFTTYTQAHEAIQDDKVAYTLEYAINRFLQTVRNPTVTRDENSYAFAAQHRPEAYAAPADLIILPAQPNAVPGPNARTIQKLVHWCTHCKKPYHNTANCDDLTGKKNKDNNKDRRGKDRSKGDRKSKSKGNKDKSKDKHRNKRSRDESSSDSEAWAAFSAESDCAVPRWALDSACSQHIAMARESFVEYTELAKGDAPAVKGIAGHRAPVGVGKVRLTVVVNGRKKELVLTDVIHIPGMPLNLISMGQLNRMSCPMSFVTKGLIHGIEFGQRGVTAWQQANNLYCLDLWEPKALLSANPKALGPSNPIDGPIPAPADASSDSDTDTERPNKTISEAAVKLWHARMGHLGHQNVKLLAKMSKGMDLTKVPKATDPCEPCTIAKGKAGEHKSHIRPGKCPLDLVHSDITGPFTRGRKGGKYFITFLDDYTKRSEVEVLERKSDAYAAYLRYAARNERGDIKIRRFRTDYGGEYSDHDFDNLRADRGTVWEPVVPSNPQQNGAAERLGQQLSGTVSTTLQDTELDKDLWPELVLAANYLRNRSPVASLGKTPYEVHTGSRPRIQHLRALGTEGWAIKRKPPTGWVKGQQRALKGRLVGYEGDHIYRMLIDDKVWRVHEVKWLKEKVLDEHTARGENLQPQPQLRPQPNPAAEPSRPMPILMDIDDADELSVQAMPPPEPLPAIVRPPPSTPTAVAVGVDNMDESSSGANTPASAASSPPLSGHPYLEQRDLSPDPLSYYACLANATDTEVYEPKTYEDAVKGNSDAKKWQEAMKDEYRSLMENKTWILVPGCPPGRKALRGKWVYTLKRGPAGEITRYKARWVVRGFEQREGVDYNETFASVVKPMSYKAIFAIAAANDWDLEQMDVKTAFLYGAVEEEIYVELPQGFRKKKGICRLLKALYGLKQSPRVWYTTFADYMDELGLEPVDADYSVFIHHKTGTLVALYVDDVLVTGPSKIEIQRVKDALNQRFHMTDLGPCSYYLGMTVNRDRQNRIIRLGQEAYIERFLKQHGMWDCNSIATPMETSSKLMPAEDGYEAPAEYRKKYQSAVGSLMYAMLGTRPDIAYAVSVVSRFSSNPTKTHVGAVKRIFRYLRSTVHWQLTYQGALDDLTGYTDSDWAGDQATRRSTAGYVFHMGSAAISWQSKRQATVALSTCEAEYMGETQATKEAIWLNTFLAQIKRDKPSKPVVIYGDNQGAIALAKNPQFHGRTKHIDIAHHFVREKVADRSVDLRYVPTDRQVADGLTKALPRDKFEAFRKLLGLEEPPIRKSK